LKNQWSLQSTYSIGGGSAPVINAQAIPTLKGSQAVDATPSWSASVVVMEVGRAHDTIKLIPCGEI
jgi:hypothetical protein